MSKRYAIFSALFMPRMGGVENYTYNLAQELSARGNQVVVVTSHFPDTPHRESLGDNLEVVRLPSYPLLEGRLPIPKINKTRRQLLRELDELSFDGVVVNTRFYLHSITGLRFASRHNLTPVLVEHGSAHLTLGNPLADLFVGWHEHAITRLVKCYKPDFYGVSEKSASWLAHFGIKALGIIPNAIDAAKFREMSSGRDFRQELSLSPNDFVVSFVGRLVPEKGIRPLLGTAQLFAQKNTGGVAIPSVRFVVAGDGPLAAAISETQLPNLSYIGPLSRADVSALLAQSDAFCLPSRSEGFATSLLESAAWGVLPIATHVGGADELVLDSSFGCLIDDANEDQIAQSVVALATRANETKIARLNLSNHVESNFSWRKTADAVETACDSARRRS